MFRNTAHIYDAVYAGKDYRGESLALTDAIRAREPAANSLLDVACGTGGHLRHLREEFDVTGVDLDASMLGAARQHLPGVPLVTADMRAFSLHRRFDAVTCLFSSIGYMATVADLDAAVANMVRHLTAGGVLIIDGWVLPEHWKEPGTVHAEATKTDDTAVARAGRSWRVGRTSHLELHHIVATRTGVEHLVDHHELTLFSHREYTDAMRRQHLAVEVIDGPFDDRERYLGIAPRA